MSADNPVLRLNRKDGTTECLVTNRSDWVLHPDGDDIAAFSLALNPEELRLAGINDSLFVSLETITYHDIGIGDNVFMIGRFRNHEGIKENIPALRFGNIAMMPKQRIVDTASGIEQEAFLVEMRSIPGYSGSPVFLYSTDAMFDMSKRDLSKEQAALRQAELDKGRPIFPVDPGPLAFLVPKGPFLLGIDFCHINNYEKVTDSNGSEIGKVRINTGMAGVIPAWKIRELLDVEVFAMNRQQQEESGKQSSETHVSLDIAEKEEASFTQQDFEADLRKATRRVEPSESDEGTK
jgi:hypothetical protein